MLMKLLCILIGFSSGLVISGAVIAFITILSVVPRLAQKTHTQQHIQLYESAILVGGLFGTLADVFELRLPFGPVIAPLFALLIGIFIGCVAVSLTEVLNVIPILTRRARIQQGMFFFVLSLALGKMVGSLIYYVIPGFFDKF